MCLNVGCIPSKALLHAAKVIAETREMQANGIHFPAPEIDLAQLRGWKDTIVARLTELEYLEAFDRARAKPQPTSYCNGPTAICVTALSTTTSQSTATAYSNRAAR